MANREKSIIYRIIERGVVVVLVVGICVVSVKAWESHQADGREADSRCPEGMVFISSASGNFCLDRYEASAGTVCPYENPETSRQTQVNLDEYDCRPVSEAGRKPWRYISRAQAAEICARAGKRLPTNNEWQAAVLGTPDQQDEWDGNDCQVKNNWPDQPGPTGLAENFRSGVGAYDMVGNVWEWVHEVVEEGKVVGKELPDSGFIQAIDADGFPVETDSSKPAESYGEDYFWVKNSSTRSLARGGYWDNGADAGKYSAYAVSELEFRGPGVGFRCASASNW
jgi:formylglycine-generating enzyme required for sulfatase activity